MSAGDRFIRVVLGAETVEFARKLREATGDLERFEKKGTSAGKALKGAFVGASLALAAIGVALKDGVEEAIKWDTVNAKLAATAKTGGFATGRFVEAIDASAEALQRRTGISKLDIVAADDLIARNQRAAQTLLGTGASVKATNQLLADLSRKMGVDAPTAATTLTRAFAAPQRAVTDLRKAKIFLTDAQDKELKALVKGGKGVQAQAALFRDLRSQVKGAADAYAQTLPGKLEIAKRNFAELKEEIGAKLIPKLKEAADAAIRFSDWARDHKRDIEAAGIAIGGLTAAIVLATGAQWLLNLAMAANPIGAVILGVVALIAIIAALYVKFDGVRYAVNIMAKSVANVLDVLLHIWQVTWLSMLDVATSVVSTVAHIGAKIAGFFGLNHVQDALNGVADVADGVRNAANQAFDEVESLTHALDDLPTSRDMEIRIHILEIQQKYEAQVNGVPVGYGFNAREAERNQQAADAKNNQAAVDNTASLIARATNFANTFKPTAKTLTGSSGGGGGASGSAKAAAKKTGQDILDAFLQGLGSKFPLVHDRVQQFSDGISVKLGHGLDSVVKAAETSLAGLQRKLDVLAGSGKGSISAATDALNTAKQTVKDYATSVRDSVNALGDLGTHGGATFDIVKDRLVQTLANAKDFARTIDALRTSGLNDTALKQLIAAGPGVATETGKAILAGGRAGIAQLNSLQASLNDVAKKTGTKVADEFYGHGVKVAQGVLDGLKSREAALKAQMKKIGGALVAAIEKGLGLKVGAKGLTLTGHRAGGGPVAAGRSYLVGENGPEILTPGASGYITPNGGGGPTVVEIHASGPTLRDIVRVEIREANRTVKRARLAGSTRSIA